MLRSELIRCWFFVVTGSGVFIAFTLAFVATVAVATTFMADDRWLLFGFILVATYTHIFAICQLPNVWHGICYTGMALQYSYAGSVVISVALTALIGLGVASLCHWFPFVIRASIFSGCVLGYAIFDTHLILQKLQSSEVIIALICMYDHPAMRWFSVSLY